MKCPYCGEEGTLGAAFSHFWLYSPGHWKYLRGNVQMFGLWTGFWATMDLACPLLNSLRHWKYRRWTLKL